MSKKSPARRLEMRQTRPAASERTDAAAFSEILRLAQAGDAVRAVAACDAFVLLHPQHAEALHLGGRLALQLGRFERAIDRLRRAAMLRPRDPAILTDFGRALEGAGKRADAETAYRAALTLDPGLGEALLNLGRLLAAFARDGEAAECYEKLLARQPDLAAARTEMAQLRLKLKMPAAALAEADAALASAPGMLEAVRIRGSALDTLGRFDEAVAARREAIGLNPGAAALRYDLGMTEMHHGRLDAAANSFRAAIALEPECGIWHRELAHLVGHQQRDAEMAAMERLHHSNGISPDDRMHVCFGLGKALEDIGAYAEAFDYFLEGNRLKRATLNYSSAETDRLFDTVKSVFTPERFAAHRDGGFDDRTPIFVLGMPRSCTSLVEQVLASHKQVEGGGEFRLLNQLVGSLASGPGFPLGEALDRSNDADLRRLGAQYVAHLRGLSAEARFVTDKLPGNFVMIGMIKLILPNATIIHCRRDPVDNCLSIFKNYFAAEHLRYAYDLSEIGHYHTRYLDLMEHWHRVLPGFVHDVSYEALVADFDGEARRLVKFCGLDWDAACGRYFEARRPVDTASAAQVRQPIFTTSIGQGARYGERLAPLLRELRG